MPGCLTERHRELALIASLVLSVMTCLSRDSLCLFERGESDFLAKGGSVWALGGRWADSKSRGTLVHC